MTKRKKKIILLQSGIFLIAIALIFATYYDKDKKTVTNSKINESAQLSENKKDAENESTIFYNLEYKGFDLNGNRYSITSKEAETNLEQKDLVYMRGVKTTFYFKNGEVLEIWSDNGVYNSENFDMNFSENVKAKYLDIELYSNNASYTNASNILIVSGNVEIYDKKGKIFAEELNLDIANKKLNFTALANEKVNASLNLK